MTGATASPSQGARYTAAMRALHWGTAALLVGSFTSIWAVSGATSGAAAARLVLLHRSFGVVILVLTAIRLCWRQRTQVPALPADLPPWQRLAARVNEVGLYTLLILQPLLGLCASMLHGDHIVLLGNLTLPGILPVDRKLAHLVFGVHGTVALLLLGLIGMHVAAALFHFFIRKDDVLAAMLPGLRRPGTPPRRAAASR
jgi:cytochrome b561